MDGVRLFNALVRCEYGQQVGTCERSGPAGWLAGWRLVGWSYAAVHACALGRLQLPPRVPSRSGGSLPQHSNAFGPVPECPRPEAAQCGPPPPRPPVPLQASRLPTSHSFHPTRALSSPPPPPTHTGRGPAVRLHLHLPVQGPGLPRGLPAGRARGLHTQGAQVGGSGQRSRGYGCGGRSRGPWSCCCGTSMGVRSRRRCHTWHRGAVGDLQL